MTCHQIEPGYGGLSGSEVYTVAKRPQEDYLVSFIRSPHAWNSKSLMPNRHINGPNIQKLVHYLIAPPKESRGKKKSPAVITAYNGAPSLAASAEDNYKPCCWS